MRRLGLVVEGHGEVQAAPVLVRRILHSRLGRYDIGVGRPIRMSRSRVGPQFPDLDRQVQLAASDSDAVLVIFDADDDCPASLGPTLLERATAAAPAPIPISVVLANQEYEAWFLASLETLRGKCGVAVDAVPPREPEAIRGAKQRLARAMAPGTYYSETVDQARMSAELDLDVARAGSLSFDKLYRDLERLANLIPREN